MEFWHHLICRRAMEEKNWFKNQSEEENRRDRLTMKVILISFTIALPLILFGCSSPSTSENNNTNTSSSATTSDYTKQDPSWSYKVENGKTTFLRNDGFSFKVNAEMKSNYRPSEEEQATTSFSCSDFSITLYNQNFESMMNNVQSDSAKGFYEKDGAKFFYSAKYTQSNNLVVTKTDNNFYMQMIAGDSVITSSSDVAKYADRFEF